MPQFAIAAAAWIGTAVTTVTTSATLGAMAANAVAALGFAQGISAGLSAWSTVAAIGAVARGRPKIGGSGGSPADWRADTRAGIPYPIGETGLGGNIVFATTAEAKNAHLLYLTVLSGCGPIEGLTGFLVGDETVTFTGDNADHARYHNKMWRRLQTGSNVPAAFDPPATTVGALAEWTSAHKLTGLTAEWLVLEYDQKAYPTGTPKTLRVGKWAKVYDPRLDSTYPGGSGSQRSGDPSTWTWSENPFLHALTYCLGRYQNGKKILGLGAMIAMIDVAAFVEGANVCDANGWKIGGVVYSTDDKTEVLAAMLQAGGGWQTRLGAKISCGVNAPRVSIATLTGAAQADGEVTIPAARAWRDRFNGVIPSYRSPAHRYEIVPASKISVATYLAEDGEDLTSEPEFPLVQSVDQAAQLGCYAVANSREFGPITVPCKPRWWGYKPNDCITVDEPEWGLNGQKCLIIERHRDPMTGIVTLSLLTETDAKHPFCLGKTGTAPPTPGLTGFDPSLVDAPGAGAFTFNGATFTSPDGDIPALTVTGTCDNPHAVELVVRYRPVGAGAWATWGPVALPAFGEAVRVEITGVTPGTDYEAQTAYRSIKGVASAWTAEGTATAGVFNLPSDSPPPSPNLWRKQDYVPAGGASSIDPAFGVSNWGFRFTSTAGTVTVSGKIFGNKPAARYSVALISKLTTGTGTAQIRVGFRDAANNPIADLADQIVTVGTTATRWSWDMLGSDDPDFVNAKFVIFTEAGDVAAGKVVDVADVIVVFGGNAPQGFAPSPDDPEGLRIYGYSGALNATVNKVYRQQTAPVAVSDGDFWVVLDGGGNAIALRQWNGSAWINPADLTASNTAAAIAGQGSLATQNAANWGSQVTGAGKPANNADVTSANTAAGIAGQSAWATYTGETPSGYQNRVQNIDAAGNLTKWTALAGINDAGGNGITFSSFPLTSDQNNIYVAATTVKGIGYSRNLPAQTISGLTAGETYGVVYSWNGNYFGAIFPNLIDLFVASPDKWLLVGVMQTKNSGGLYDYDAPGQRPGFLGGDAKFNTQYV
ncbi:hypothetical protein [Phenylobacterium sp.]|uniref:hypothetical protein n=1 Tax=Phenylobacterium sp. TaxID=1871053 RepID=UPI00395132C6